MHRWARLIIALVLAAALPLQGIAAATMQLCAPRADDAVSSESVHHATVAADSLSPHSMHHHHGKTETVKVASSDAERPPAAAPAAKSKCSVCAACCAGAALPAAPIRFGEAAPDEALVPTLQSPAPAFLTTGLERPPRPSLA